MNNINLAVVTSQVISRGNIFQLLSNLTSLLIKNFKYLHIILQIVIGVIAVIAV